MELALAVIGDPNGAALSSIQAGMTALGNELGLTGPMQAADGAVESANRAMLRLYRRAATMFDRPSRQHLVGVQTLLAAGRDQRMYSLREILEFVIGSLDEGYIDVDDAQTAVRAALTARAEHPTLRPTIEDIVEAYLQHGETGSSGSTTPRAASPVRVPTPRPESPEHRGEPWTGPGLIAALTSAEVPPSQHHVGLEARGATRMRDRLGPDVMGLRVPAPPPAALRNLYASLPNVMMRNVLRQLPANRVAPFMRALSMTHGTLPTDLTVETLPVAPVISVRRPGNLREWAGTDRTYPPLWTDTVETPRVAFAIWLGSPMSEHTADGDLNQRLASQRANLASWAATYGGVLDFVLFTDIPRATFDQVRHLTQRPADSYLGEVWDMLMLARGEGQGQAGGRGGGHPIHLVNVDEVFNSQLLSGPDALFVPELAATVRELFAAYRMEVSHLSRSGAARASDILRMLVEVYFGGLYLEPDNNVNLDVTPRRLLEQLTAALAARPAAVMKHQGILFGPAAHPLFQHQLGKIRERYNRTVDDLLGRANLGRREVRDETTQRTGNYVETVHNSFGNREEISILDFVEVARGDTWSFEPPGRGWPESPQRTLHSAKRHVATLIRQLNNRPGVLDLGAVADAIKLESDPAAVWEGVLGYLAQSRFASSVTKVVDARYSSARGGREPEVIPIVLPPAAAAYLSIDTDPGKASVELGQRVRPGQLRVPLEDAPEGALRDADQSPWAKKEAEPQVVEASADSEVFLAADGMLVRRAVLDWQQFLETITQIGRVTGIYTVLDADRAHRLAEQDANQGAGDVPAVMRFQFGRVATGLKVDGSLQSWSPEQLAEAAETYDFLWDSADVLRLHPRLLADVILDAASFTETAAEWRDPATFVYMLEYALMRAAQFEVAQERERRSRPQGGDRAVPATSAETGSAARPEDWTPTPADRRDLAAIRYAEEAALFERGLGGFLLIQPDVEQQAAVLVAALWERANESQRRRLGDDPRRGTPGAVGDELGLLQRVVESGNARERLAVFFHALANGVLTELLGTDALFKSTLLESEQNQREKVTDADVVPSLPLPDEVVPPLSPAEWLTVRRGRLPWRPAATLLQVPMSGTMQQDAQRTGGLIWTSTSGTAYVFTRAAYEMARRWGIDVDYGALRRLIVGGNLACFHHTFHEAMRGVAMAAHDLGLPPPDGAENWYVDDWYRYHQLLPEDALRTHVAHDGLFPEEHAADILGQESPS